MAAFELSVVVSAGSSIFFFRMLISTLRSTDATATKEMANKESA